MNRLQIRIKEYKWFLIVGIVGFIVDSLLLNLIVYFINFDIYTSRIISFLIAVIITWQLNRMITFKKNFDKKRSVFHVIGEFFKYLMSSSISMSINLGIYFYITIKYEYFRTNLTASVAVGSGIAMVFSFLMFKYWVFKKEK